MKTDYFELIASQAKCSLEAAKLLKEILTDYNSENIKNDLARIHDVEHRADEIRHTVIKRLAKDFITPIGQEELAELTRLMDDVTDAIDEVTVNMYMYAVKTLPDDVLDLVEIMLSCVSTLFDATVEFRNHKKPDALMKLLIEVNDQESKADAIYMEAMRKLFNNAAVEPMYALGVKAVYDALESCCDLCEHAADVMEGVVMNNL